MILRFWHLDLIPDSVRTQFELPEWPYAVSKFGPLPDSTLRYFQQWGTVRVELEGKATKLMVPLRADHPKFPVGEYANNWKGVFACCTSSCQIDPDTLHVLAWNRRDPTFDKLVGKVPDNAAWLEWNRAMDVKYVNSQAVGYA